MIEPSELQTQTALVGKYEPWHTRLNRPQQPTDSEDTRSITYVGVPYPVDVDNPPCGEGKNLSHCETFGWGYGSYQSKVKEIRSIRATVAGVELTFGEDGIAILHYGRVTLSVSKPTASYAAILLRAHLKSWANETRVLNVTVVYVE